MACVPSGAPRRALGRALRRRAKRKPTPAPFYHVSRSAPTEEPLEKSLTVSYQNHEKRASAVTVLVIRPSEWLLGVSPWAEIRVMKIALRVPVLVRNTDSLFLRSLA